MTKHTILCVDDEVDNVDALERIFRQKYSVLKATSGKEALKILANHPGELAVIITDQRMPEMTGSEFLSESLKSHPNTIRILLTGYTDIQTVIEAVNRGEIYRYINKPWDPYDLVATVDRAVERYELNEELKRKNRELEAALNELKTLDQAKSNFMILINHELKTPLTSILSFGQLLAESSLNEEQKLFVDRIGQSTERLKQLVNDALWVARGETKTIPVNIRSFDCNQISLKLPDPIQDQLTKKNQELQSTWIDKKIVGDKALVEEVFLRLVHNAIKFGKEQSKIEVSAELAMPHRAKFTISNRGPTIPEHLLKQILKPFFLNEDVMKHTNGMGLGLAVCQVLLKAMNSELTVENSQDGVRASFQLPSL